MGLSRRVLSQLRAFGFQDRLLKTRLAKLQADLRHVLDVPADAPIPAPSAGQPIHRLELSSRVLNKSRLDEPKASIMNPHYNLIIVAVRTRPRLSL